MMRLLVHIVLALAIAVHAGPAIAQPYPSKPVRMIVGFAAGGGTDLQARMLAQKLSEYWGQPVVVENRAGAGGVLGADLVAKAAPDGYTLMLGSINQNAIAPAVLASMPYNAAKDFAPVVNVSYSPLVLNVNPSVPVRTVAELTDLAKARPEQIGIASGGNGTTQHLAIAMYMIAAGVRVVHVPYKGSGQAVADLLSGQIQAAFDVLPPSISYIRDGRLRALAVTTHKRAPQLPDVPTMEEAGLKGFEIINWYGIFAPAGTPANIVAKLNADINKALQDPTIVKRFEDSGLVVTGGTSEAFATYVQSEIVKFDKLAKAANIKVE
jgi:tripartite-type tricarboxylate transporter receptor subunit TctC